ncbi:MAG: peptide deformylase, partial [Burkholderiales bacterium]|nr:peptide deformylase [Burkholderiales bacterium]
MDAPRRFFQATVTPLKIVHYPHPALRHPSKPVRRVDAQLKNIVAQMFELMYDQRGVGLAANQVNLPLQLFVVNESGERGADEERVFINPVVQA